MDRPARSETETGDVGIAHREVVGESGLLNGIQILRFAARQVMMAVVSNDEACRPLQMPFLGDDFVRLQAGTVTRMQADTSARFGTEAREAVEEFVADTARELDTYGKNRKFTTALGVELTLPSGGYGWKTDKEGESQELIQLIYQGSVLEKEPLYTSRGANKGSDDIGDSYVEIDLSNQHLYLFWEGEIVLESDFVSGDMTKSGRMTPPGVFGLTYKTRNAVLRGEDYETPVNYWMPFNGNIGMHDATWRSSFGGSIYITNGSHGCVNLPLDKAAQIYEYVSTGFPVICYYY